MQQKAAVSKKPMNKRSAPSPKAKTVEKASIISAAAKSKTSKPTISPKTKNAAPAKTASSKKSQSTASTKDLDAKKSTSPVNKKADGKSMEAKWGAQTIKAAGFTSVPNLLIDYQQKLKIDSVDLNILLILMKHWWTAGEFPWPSKDALANLTGKEKGTIQKHLRHMEGIGLLKRDYQYDSKNKAQLNTLYDLSGLIKKLSALAKEELEEKAARKEKDDRKKRGR